MSQPADTTELLVAARRGDRVALDRPFANVYHELRPLAHRQLARARPGETLCTTALVHAAYLKLTDVPRLTLSGRRHFFAVADRAMRQIVIAQARRAEAQKRGGEAARVDVEPGELGDGGPHGGLTAPELVALHRALTTLEALSQRLARVVELRFFGGLSVEETGEARALSPRTVKRDWRKARGFLFQAVEGTTSPEIILVDHAAPTYRRRAPPWTPTVRCTQCSPSPPSDGSGSSRSSTRLSTCPPESHAAFLDRVCLGDPELRAQVEALLAADRAAEAFLETRADLPVASLLHAAQDADVRSREGERVGPYRIVRELGRGGMGTVYLAERADGQFEQRVALKLIRRGMDSEEILRRFLQERQILACLDHPHIARLLDGGLTPDGQPFLAMEYIEGVPITRYCDEHRLDLTARLRLFRAVGEAVAYAHRSLVVHRDLKPGNILVTADGQVKLLDFGIAKLLEEGADPEQALTRSGVYLLTPEYAAPEQVLGEAITTATDVYALGCVLYELLTGHRAHRFVQRSPAELARVVRQVEPVPPSAVIGRSDEIAHADGLVPRLTPAAVGRARGVEPARLQRQVRGELDAIVLKALRKEPERRYATVDLLLEDLHRRATGRPVLARRETLLYRARKFLGRHRAGMAAAVLVLLSLFGGLAAASWQARLASREAAKAREITEFVPSLFRETHPEAARGAELTARDLLDRGAARVEAELKGQPALQAEMLHVLGSLYIELGAFDPARPLLERALAMRRSLAGPARPEVAATLYELSRLHSAQGDLEAAERLAREALALRRRLHGEAHAEVGRSLRMLGAVLADRGELNEAERLTRQALAIHRQQLGPRDPELLSSVNNLAVVLHNRGEHAKAEPLLREVVELYRHRSDAEDPRLALTLANLASVVRAGGRLEEAERLHREALALRRKMLGDEHPDVSVSLNNLAVVLLDMQRLAEAESLHREALRLRIQAYGRDHVDVAQSLHHLAGTLHLQGKHSDAEPLSREAAEIVRRKVGDRHPVTPLVLGRLAAILHARGATAEASATFRHALALARNAYPDRHPVLAVMLREYETHLRESGRAEQPQPLRQREDPLAHGQRR